MGHRSWSIVGSGVALVLGCALLLSRRDSEQNSLGPEAREARRESSLGIAGGGLVLPRPGVLQASPAIATTSTESTRWRDFTPGDSNGRFVKWLDEWMEGGQRTTDLLLLERGLSLAQERAEWMGDLIEAHPRHAIESAVPSRVRNLLPAVFHEWVEEHLDGRGDLAVRAALPQPGRESEVEPITRQVTMAGREFRAVVFGRRLDEASKTDIPLHGIALMGRMAVSEDPVRVLQPSEAIPAAEAVCSLSGAAAEALGTPLAIDAGNAQEWVCSTAHVSALNERLLKAEAGGGSPDAEGILRPESAYTEGLKKVVFIRVDFTDLPGAPFTDERATNLIRNLHEFYFSSSYGRAGIYALGDGSAVTDTLRLPKTAAEYGKNDASTLRRDARAAARSAGFRLEDFSFDVVCFGPVPGFGWAGLGMVGQPGAWVRDSFGESAGVFAHELGHNLGLNHANFWDTSGQSIIGRGQSVEYGDSFDTMGNASAGRRHFNARYKNYLNWLPNEGVKAFTTNGIYRITAHDSSLATGTRALRIPRNSQTNYWVEFRQLFTDRPALMNGVGLRWARSGNQSSLLLDTTPGSTDGKNDSALVLGRTFADRDAGIFVTPIQIGGTSPESIDVMVNKGQFTNNHPPVVTLEFGLTNGVPNTPLEFSARAIDADGDDLAYFWEPSDGNLDLNKTGFTKSWTTAGEYVVRCTVSDMKGGTASASTLVVIGTPRTFHITGRVTGKDGALEGVRVSVSSTQSAVTDANGWYAITGLTTGSYVVKASADNYLFMRQGFASPLVINGSKDTIDFIAVPRDGVEVASLIAPGSVWRYNDKGEDLGVAWRSMSFDDSGWDHGAASLGYGDDNIVTQLEFGGSSANRYITYYFRREFVVADLDESNPVTLGIMRDDGAVVYLNGTEVFRSNLPSGTITAQTLASTRVGSADETYFFEKELDPVVLRRGTNVVAVEVHQVAAGSSDVRFDLRLTGLRATGNGLGPSLVLRVAGTDLRLEWPIDGNWILQEATRLVPDPDWAATSSVPQIAGSEQFVTIPVAVGPRYFRLIGSVQR